MRAARSCTGIFMVRRFRTLLALRSTTGSMGIFCGMQDRSMQATARGQSRADCALCSNATVCRREERTPAMAMPTLTASVGGSARNVSGGSRSGAVVSMMGAKDLGTAEFPAMGTALITGDLAFRQHDGGHTAAAELALLSRLREQVPARAGSAGALAHNCFDITIQWHFWPSFSSRDIVNSSVPVSTKP